MKYAIFLVALIKLYLNCAHFFKSHLFLSRHYRQAYNQLLELKMPNAHLLEFKVVAGFINFKVFVKVNDFELPFFSNCIIIIGILRSFETKYTDLVVCFS